MARYSFCREEVLITPGGEAGDAIRDSRIAPQPPVSFIPSFEDLNLFRISNLHGGFAGLLHFENGVERRHLTTGRGLADVRRQFRLSRLGQNGYRRIERHPFGWGRRERNRLVGSESACTRIIGRTPTRWRGTRKNCSTGFALNTEIGRTPCCKGLDLEGCIYRGIRLNS